VHDYLEDTVAGRNALGQAGRPRRYSAGMKPQSDSLYVILSERSESKDLLSWCVTESRFVAASE